MEVLQSVLLLDVVVVIESVRMQWAGLVVRMKWVENK
jgi:hypothetical protein